MSLGQPHTVVTQDLPTDESEGDGFEGPRKSSARSCVYQDGSSMYWSALNPGNLWRKGLSSLQDTQLPEQARFGRQAVSNIYPNDRGMSKCKSTIACASALVNDGGSMPDGRSCRGQETERPLICVVCKGSVFTMWLGVFATRKSLSQAVEDASSTGIIGALQEHSKYTKTFSDKRIGFLAHASIKDDSKFPGLRGYTCN